MSETLINISVCLSVHFSTVVTVVGHHRLINAQETMTHPKLKQLLIEDVKESSDICELVPLARLLLSVMCKCLLIDMNLFLLMALETSFTPMSTCVDQ